MTATFTVTGTGYALGGNQVASQNVGILGVGECKTIYWFIIYPCAPEAQVGNVTVDLVDDGGVTLASSADVLITEKGNSASATGLLGTQLLTSENGIGQISSYDVQYEFGNTGAGDDINFQPVGNTNFDAECFQLVGVEILESDFSCISVGNLDEMFFTIDAACAVSGSGNFVKARFFFQLKCVGSSTEAQPYAYGQSGTPLKYSGNFDSVPLTVLPPTVNYLNITKTVSPTTAPAAPTTITYTVAIENTSAAPASIDNIADLLPGTFAFNSIDGTSDVTVVNATVVPNSGDTGTIDFVGGSAAATYPYTEFFIPANSTLNLVYSVDIPGGTAGGAYDNSATFTAGTFTSDPATATFLLNFDDDNDGVANDVDICPGFDDNADNDNDSVPDGCDQDDDNDGIIDTDEGLLCSPSPINVGAAPGGNQAGVGEILDIYDFDGINVDVTTAIVDIDGNTALTQLLVEDPMTLRIQGDNADDGTGESVNYIYTFSEPVVDPEFLFSGIDGGDRVTISATGPSSVNVVIGNMMSPSSLSGNYNGTPLPSQNPSGTDLFAISNNNTASPTITSFTSGSSNTTLNASEIKISGIVTSFTITTRKAREDGDNVNNGNVTFLFSDFSYCSAVDTDNDLIPDYLDSDSDGDGCSDTVEAGFVDAIAAVDEDGQLGDPSPPTVDPSTGLVTSGTGYTEPTDTNSDGTYDFQDASISSACFSIVDDTDVTDEDTPINIDVLDNDTVVGTYDGDPGHEIIAVTDPANGTVTIEADGTVTYSPDADFNGTDTFDYTVTVTNADGTTTTETATVVVVVTPVDDVMDDTATTPEDTPVVVDVLDNDGFDPASDVEVTDVTDPANGTVTINADGTVTYTPDPDFNGTDTFDYTVTVTNPDGSTTTETATVVVVVTPVDDVMDDTATTPEDTPVVVDVLDNDGFDPASDVEVTDVTDPANGTVTINADGTVTYTPDPDFNGTDTFDYTVTVTNPDGSTTTETATVVVVVTPVDDVMDDTATTPQDTPVDIDVLTNDGFDPGTDVEVTDVTDPANGTVTINADGTVTYTPDPDFTGTDTFDYTVTITNPDGSTTTETATVIVTVLPVSMEITKTSNYDATTGVITYTYIVENTGDVTLFDIVVNEDATVFTGSGPLPTPVYDAGGTDEDGEADALDLLPGASLTFTADYTVTQADINAGQVDNQASASAVQENGNPAEDTASDDGIDNDGNIEDDITETILPVGTITGTVYNDLNGNGIQDAGEPGIPGVDIEVTDALGNTQTVTTDANGDYTAEVIAGTATVDIDETSLPVDSVQTGGTDPTDVNVTAGGTFFEENNGYNVPGTVEGHIYDDLNGNGVQDPGEPDLAGVDVVITDENGNTQTVTTDANGNYSADVPAGDVTVDIDESTLPVGTVQSEGTDPTVVTVTSGNVSFEENNGFVLPDGMLDIEKVSSYNVSTGIITYTYNVTNTGNVTVFDIEVIEDAGVFTGTGLLPVPVYSSGGSDEDGEADALDLLPGATLSFTADYVVTAADIASGQIDNQASASGIDIGGNPQVDVSDDGDDTDGNTQNDVTETDVSATAQLTFVKTSSATGSNVGDIINYVFQVENTGLVTVDNVTIDDPVLGITGLAVTPSTLAPGEIGTATASYTITQADVNAGQVVNSATAMGQDPSGVDVTDTSDSGNPADDTGAGNDETITTLDPNPEITFVKTSQALGTDLGDTILYTFTVTNTGNVTVTNVAVTDPVLGVASLPVTPSTLGAGESGVATATYIITQADIDTGFVVNTATATGNDPAGNPVDDTSDSGNIGDDTGADDDSTITSLTPSPNLDLEKSGIAVDTNGNGIIDAGDEIEYTFVIFNNGNTTITGITISDPIITVTGGPIDLDPGQTDSTTFTGVYVITQADVELGEVINQATALGSDPNGNIVMDVSDDPTDATNDDNDTDGDFEDITITIIDQIGNIDLLKTAMVIDINANGFTDAGDQIAYTFTVTNTGNVALFGIVITDPLVAVVGGPIDLGPGETDSTSFTALYTITDEDIINGEVVNSAIAEGSTGFGETITDVSDDPLDTTDVDIDGDGDAEDVTVVTIDPVDPPEEDEMVVFSGVSPNGDGVNDFWVIQGIENFPNNTVRLFNRWGVEVFSEKGYGQDDKFFRGLSNGRSTIAQEDMLPVGTYYYAIEYVNDENKTIQLGGYIYITR